MVLSDVPWETPSEGINTAPATNAAMIGMSIRFSIMPFCHMVGLEKEAEERSLFRIEEHSVRIEIDVEPLKFPQIFIIIISRPEIL